MATPFKVFRDNQKILLAIFGVLLMIAFVVMPPLVDTYRPGPSGPQQEDKVLVKLGDEELNSSHVRRLTNKFQTVAIVMGSAIQQSLAMQGTPNPPMPPIPGLVVQQIPQEQGGMMAEVTQVPSEVAVRFHAWAKKADELGVVIDDQAVRDFLRETSGGRLSDLEYNAIITNMVQSGQMAGLNYDYFFEMVRDVLKAQKVQALVIRDGRVITPTAAWVAYRNFNRSISVEMFPVRVADYLDQVGEPTEQQVQELFEKYRYQERNPFANQIGFRQVDKLALAYVKGDIETFLDAAKQEITAEQVQEHYEENKDSFRKPTLPPAEPDAPEQTAPEDMAPANETPADAPEESPVPETEAPADEPEPQSPADDSADQPEAPTDSPAPQSESAPETPAAPEAEAPAEEPATDENPAAEAPATEDSSQRNRSQQTLRLVSFLQEEQAEEAPAEQENPEAEAAPAEQAPMQEPSPEQPQPMEGTPASEAPMDAPAEVAPIEQPAQPEQPMTEAVPTEEPPQEEAPVEYRPLEEVEEQIRTRLAQPIAQQKLNEAIAQIRDRLQAQYEEYRYAREQNQEEAPYDTTAIQQQAEELGLSFGTLPLMDLYTASETDLGETAVYQQFVRDPVQMFRQENRSLIAEAFQSNAPLYQPRIFPGTSTDPMVLQLAPPDVQYLYWKTEQQEGYLPELEDVRDEVVETWKEQEATKLAKAEAEKLAQQIDSSEALNQAATQAGKDVFVEQNITYFNQLSQQNLTLGEIPSIEKISQRTMEALFSTPVGESTVAPNADETVFYVSFVTEETQTPEELRDQLLTAIQGQLPLSVISYASQEENVVGMSILQDFFDPTHIQWQVNPAELDSEL